MDGHNVDGLLDIGSGRAPRSDAGVCESCAGPYARRWSTPQGTARLCATCATLHGFGCP